MMIEIGFLTKTMRQIE